MIIAYGTSMVPLARGYLNILYFYKFDHNDDSGSLIPTALSTNESFLSPNFSSGREGHMCSISLPVSICFRQVCI